MDDISVSVMLRNTLLKKKENKQSNSPTIVYPRWKKLSRSSVSSTGSSSGDSSLGFKHSQCYGSASDLNLLSDQWKADAGLSKHYEYQHRGTCYNCKKTYLLSLSKSRKFCSLDCKAATNVRSDKSSRRVGGGNVQCFGRNTLVYY